MSVDNVEDLIISFDEFNELDKSGVENPTMRVQGKDIVGFNYKIVEDLSDCSDVNGYISVGGTSTVVDLKAQQDGPNTSALPEKSTQALRSPTLTLKPALNGCSTDDHNNCQCYFDPGVYGEGSSIEVLR